MSLLVCSLRLLWPSLHQLAQEVQAAAAAAAAGGGMAQVQPLPVSLHTPGDDCVSRAPAPPPVTSAGSGHAASRQAVTGRHVRQAAVMSESAFSSGPHATATAWPET